MFGESGGASSIRLATLRTAARLISNAGLGGFSLETNFWRNQKYRSQPYQVELLTIAKTNVGAAGGKGQWVGNAGGKDAFIFTV